MKDDFMIIDVSNELCRIKDMNLYVFEDEKNVFNYVKKLTDLEYDKYYQKYLSANKIADELYKEFKNYSIKKIELEEMDKLIKAKKLMVDVLENLKIIHFLIANNDLIKKSLHSDIIKKYETKLFKIIQDSNDFKIGYLDDIFANFINK